MNLTYVSLLFTVISCFAFQQKIITVSLGLISVLIALSQGIIDFYGLIAILLFYVVTYICFENKNKIMNAILLIIILLIVECVFLHIIPGFYNTLVINKTQLSSLSLPFSMYLNFDKTIFGIILFINSNLYKIEKPLDKQSIWETLLILLGCSLSLIIFGLCLHYIKFDFKISDSLIIWCINNLFFVCLSEEVIFRGIIQNKLKTLLKQKNLPYIHIILTSLIFGLVHFQGGLSYIFLATICGIFYSFVYERTDRILCAILIHFGLNLIHVVFFTYPASIDVILPNV